MKHLEKYENFINEGLFSSRYGNIVDKIYKIVKTIDLNDIRLIKEHGYYSIVFIIRKENNNKNNDPYGEECWDDDVEIKLTKNFTFKYYRNYDYGLIINGDKLEVTNQEAKKLYKTAMNRLNRRDQEEIDARINRAIKNIQLL
jgi:hypothetical protein